MSEQEIDSLASEPRATYLKDYQVPVFLIDEVELDFDLNDDHTIVKSALRVRRNRLSTNKQKAFILNGKDLTLISVAIDKQSLIPDQYQITKSSLIISEVPDSFSIEIITKIYPQKNTALSGLYRSANTYCTQCEAQGFRRITYFLDQPDILSRYTTKISADAKQYPILLSNGNLIGSGSLENGRHWVKWEDPFNKPSYLFALVAGDFDLLEDTFVTQSNREIQLRIYVDKGYLDQTHHAMYSLKEAMRWDEKAYGREYDLDIYMIVAIGDFNAGAMENKGLNIFNTKYILAKPETANDEDYMNILSVIGHEYFHNWSGNRVTCRDWFQLSLKEGLTIFRDQSFSEDMISPGVMRIREVNGLREIQFPEDAGPLAHPVRPDSYIEINNFYTSTIYSKGAEVLRMMQTILGKAMFRKGMDLYFTRHDGQAVTIEDFVRSMEDVSGVDLRHFRLWYSQAGTPVITVEDDYDAQKKVYRLTMHQQTPATPGSSHKKPLHIPVRMGLLDKQGNELPLQINNEPIATEKVLAFTAETQTFQFENIDTLPVPSLLRNFSAPVKLNYACSDEQLRFLFKYDKDSFNRWEAGQKYIMRVLLNLVTDYQQDKPLKLSSEVIEMYEYVLQHDHADDFLLAEMIVVPSEKYIAEQMEVIDVDAIHAAREFLITEIAKQLQKTFLNIYQNYTEDEATFSSARIGKHQLKNRCFLYLMLLPEYENIGVSQFNASYQVRMADAQPALTGLSNIDTPARTKALDQFYANWKHDALVIDKWLSIQAASKLPNTLQTVKNLMRHEAFDIKNPNKVYSLIGTFGQRNPSQFHAKTGEGYAFLGEVVRQLNQLNPQVAARMVNPLTTWRRYDSERQKLMRAQLELLLQDKQLSKDLYEIVSKSLGENIK